MARTIRIEPQISGPRCGPGRVIQVPPPGLPQQAAGPLGEVAPEIRGAGVMEEAERRYLIHEVAEELHAWGMLARPALRAGPISRQGSCIGSLRKGIGEIDAVEFRP